MIKKRYLLIIPAIIILTIVALALNGCKSKKNNKTLSLIKARNYVVTDEEKEIKLILYFTVDNCFNYHEIVDEVSFSNNEGDKKMVLRLNKITKTKFIHYFDDVKYNAYEYYLSIPVISNDFVIENAYFCILADGKTAKYEIGSINLFYYPNVGNSSDITVNYLIGQAKYEPYQTLDFIDVRLENKLYNNMTIDSIWIDNDIKLDFSKDLIIGYMEKQYRLSFTYQKKKIVDMSYIIVNYTVENEERKYVIDTFCFYENGYEIPNDNDVVRVYKNDNNA